jgi:hypothetical protein
VVSGRIRQRIVDLVAARGRFGITRSEVLSLAYAADPDGGPSSPNTVSVLIGLANKELAPQGFRIAPAWPGHGGRYRLEKVVP